MVLIWRRFAPKPRQYWVSTAFVMPFILGGFEGHFPNKKLKECSLATLIAIGVQKTNISQDSSNFFRGN